MKQEMVDWYQKEGKPVLEKSFKHHDKDDSKALEREEAKDFSSTGLPSLSYQSTISCFISFIL